jgi:small subunit ribosomal protein S1
VSWSGRLGIALARFFYKDAEGMTDNLDDFTTLLDNVEEMANPRRGDLLHGHILAIDTEGLIVDLGLKRDGIVPCTDLDKLAADDAAPNVGDEVAVMVIDPLDRDGNLIVSISQARESTDWIRANRLMDQQTILELKPNGYNRGGLIVPFGRLRAFVPASHLSELPKGLDEASRSIHLERMVGRKMPFKVIEVDPRRRRLVLSERKAVRQWRQDRKTEMIGKLEEGEIRSGRVTSLREFGAFVDIGGADGLVHISELSWNRVDDPSEIVKIGQEIEIQVIRLDREANRIGLSLKRLQPSPWEAAVGKIEAGQEHDGIVSHIAASGVYILVGDGPEGLLQVDDETPMLSVGQQVRIRVSDFDPERERLDIELVADALETTLEDEEIIS